VASAVCPVSTVPKLKDPPPLPRDWKVIGGFSRPISFGPPFPLRENFHDPGLVATPPSIKIPRSRQDPPP